MNGKRRTALQHHNEHQDAESQNPTRRWTEPGDRSPSEAKFFWTGGPVQVAPDTWFTSVGSGVTAFATSDGLVLVDSGTRLFAQVGKELEGNHETLRTWVRTAEAAQRPGAADESAKDAELAGCARRSPS